MHEVLLLFHDYTESIFLFLFSSIVDYANYLIFKRDL